MNEDYTPKAHLDLTKLREIAEAATPGPWGVYEIDKIGPKFVAAGEDGCVTDMCSPEDADHIATFDPPTVLALIDEIERLRGAYEITKHASEIARTTGQTLHDATAALMQAVAAVGGESDD